MPYRTFKCYKCHHVVEELQSIHEDTNPRCCGNDMSRDYALENNKSKSSSITHRFGKPIEMISVALDNEAQIKGFQERNPNIEISSDRSNPNFGVPIAHTRQEKLQVLNNEGFVERN